MVEFHAHARTGRKKAVYVMFSISKVHVAHLLSIEYHFRICQVLSNCNRQCNHYVNDESITVSL